MKHYNRSKIMQIAHAIKSSCASFGEAQEKAWAAYKLAKAMRESREVLFTFLKADGSQRVAKGTLVAELLPETKGTGKSKPMSIVTYFDLDRNAFRSFNAARLVAA